VKKLIIILLRMCEADLEWFTYNNVAGTHHSNVTVLC